MDKKINPTMVPLDKFIHKLNNPLGALMLWAQELAKPLGDEQRHEIAECLLREVRALSGLLKRVAVVDGAKPPRWARVRMDAVVRQALAAATVDLPGAAVPLISLPDSAVFLDGDAPMLAGLVEQLLRNAMESGSDKVWINLEKGEGSVLLEVCDDGSGIEGVAEDDIWRPFFSTKPGHAGIGLSLVSRAVQEHAGTLHLVPRKPMGTRVLVNLPIKRMGGLRES